MSSKKALVPQNHTWNGTRRGDLMSRLVKAFPLHPMEPTGVYTSWREKLKQLQLAPRATFKLSLYLQLFSALHIECPIDYTHQPSTNTQYTQTLLISVIKLHESIDLKQNSRSSLLLPVPLLPPPLQPKLYASQLSRRLQFFQNRTRSIPPWTADSMGLEPVHSFGHPLLAPRHVDRPVRRSRICRLNWAPRQQLDSCDQRVCAYERVRARDAGTRTNRGCCPRERRWPSGPRTRSRSPGLAWDEDEMRSEWVWRSQKEARWRDVC